ncbi:hypothetical protein N0V93_005444 [Gnomoniopsis smithogilvyi]|uniref:GST N-terminal domain-containing protein n=1 Tax=Gnomoniopsis smithogilvyi TaxID=1191159 RepID=A0A9W8YTB5_9PEZI|nr:hypothetical protein N0V93_005444 [Gnomoniopsis smithogilvyi]
MAATQKITFFDLASKDGTAWSLNPWKTRFLLNFKGLDYETEWLEYPNLKSRLEPHISASAYTIPTIAYNDGRYIMDSRVIVDVIEKDHPSPPLHLDSPYLKKLEEILAPQIMPALRGSYIPLVPKRLLNEASLEYWYRTREEKVGMKLDVLENTEGGEPGFAKAEPLLRQVTSWLKENDGPFFMGNTVSYADFVWAGFLIFFRRIGTDKFEPLLEKTGDPSLHLALLSAVEPWSKRDDH